MFELFFNEADRPWLLDTLTLQELKTKPNQYFNALSAFKREFPLYSQAKAEHEFDQLFFDATFSLDGQILEY